MYKSGMWRALAKPIHVKRWHQWSTQAAAAARTTDTAATTTRLCRTFVSSQLDNASVEPLSLQRTYRYLKLQAFTNEELDVSFDRIKSFPSDSGEKNDDDDDIGISQMRGYLRDRVRDLESKSMGKSIEGEDEETERAREDFCDSQAVRLMQLFRQTSPSSSSRQDASSVYRIQREDFKATITRVASKVDVKRTWPITTSMLLVGASVGVITPAMPFVVENLGLTPGQYGTVVSAFALAKMTGNIPAAVGVERHGRKPYMTYSLAIVAVGVTGIGFANSFETLYLCRLMTGLGVAALSTAGTMMMTDLSTPLNRASTMAPIMSAFAAGTALGPALGGYLVDNVGLHPTFYMVGVSYLGVASFNRFILDETKPTTMTFEWQDRKEHTAKNSKSSNDEKPPESIAVEVQKAIGQWVPLAKDPSIRNVLIMNGAYWVSLAGSQMTLLPLILTDSSGLAMTATQVGSVYMGMSTIQIVGNPIFARFVDRVGKVPAITGGCALISSAMASLPFCASTGDMTYLAASLGLWAVGSSMLSTAPVAYISDQVDAWKRAQAIAMLRTSGDVGFLIGATGTGALADFVGSLDFAMQSSAGLLLTATTWFAARQVLNAKLLLASNGETKKV